MMLTDPAGASGLTGAGVLAGLLAGGLVDRVAVRLPAAMERAWRAEGSDPARDRPVRGSPFRALGVRLLCGGAFGALAARFGFTPVLAAALAATAVLMILALIDARHRLLPDVITVPFLGAGLLVNGAGTFVSLRDASLGAVIGYAGLWILARAYRFLFGREGIGAGDLKLLAALGAWFGWQTLLPLTQTAAVLALMSVLAVRPGRPWAALTCTVPYGTYLAAAGWIVLAFGPELPPGPT